MANEERCIRCGEQETDHIYGYRETCGAFVSEITHKKDCPVLGCDGNCDKTIAAEDERTERELRRGAHTRAFGPGGTLFVWRD